VAGWLLPDDANRNLPQDIEDAVIDEIASSASQRSRDAMLKSESVVGVGSFDYFQFGGSGSGSVSGSIVSEKARAKLDPYKHVVIA
jgi:hypothetical protein